MAAESFSLSLDTAYLSIPGAIWDVLLLATLPQEHEDGEWVVSCETDTFPELVVGLDGGGERCDGVC